MYLPHKEMASDEFISLEAPCEADAKDEGGDIQVKAPDVNGAEPLASELQPEGESGVVGSCTDCDWF